MGWSGGQVFTWHSGSCVGAGAQQVRGSRRLVQDVHMVPRRPPSRPRVGPRGAAFHLSGSVLLGAQHLLLVTELPRRQPVSCGEKRLGMWRVVL